MKKSNMYAQMMILMVIIIGVLINAQASAASMGADGNPDRAVAMTVASKIAHDPLLGGMPIGVAAYKGKITLSGAVHTQQQKDRATEDARSADGVKKVNNLLEVVEPMMKR